MSGKHNTQRGSTHRCQSCGKDSYSCRADAKAHRQQLSYGRQLHAYRCPVDETTFHLGHLPRVVRRGLRFRSELYE